MADVDGKSTGQRIHYFRKQAGMSQRLLGARVGRSAEWVKAVENGRLLAPRLPMLTQIAAVLGVRDIAQLVEDGGGVPAEVFAGTRHAALSEVQAALTDYRITSDARLPSVPHLRVRLSDASRRRSLGGSNRARLRRHQATRPLLEQRRTRRLARHYVYARRGRHGDAWAWWEQADQLARRLGSEYRHVQSFSESVMAAHAVTLGVELRRPGEALRAADSFDPNTIPSLARRSRHLIEVARAHHQRDERAATWAMLNRSERTAPETIKYNGYAREMLLSLRDRPPSGLRDDVRDLCDRVGLAH